MISSDKIKDTQNDLGCLIWMIFKFWQRGKHRMLDEFGLTISQLEIMGAIYHRSENDKEINQNILSQDTSIDPMTVSIILRNLQKKGLIHRRQSRTDSRAKVVEITEKGDELFTRAMTKVREKQETLFQNVDKEVLIAQLQVLLNALEAGK
jgi:DNA-binding MarR family transcriptional regulator